MHVAEEVGKEKDHKIVHHQVLLSSSMAPVQIYNNICAQFMYIWCEIIIMYIHVGTLQEINSVA